MIYWTSTILGAWFLADIISGVVHWWEDRYLTSDSKWWPVASIAQNNELHHKKPWAMGEISAADNIRATMWVGIPFAMILFLNGSPNILWLAVFFSSFGNLVHRYAHVPIHQRSKLVQFFQSFGLFISVNHHATHHYDTITLDEISKEDASIRYCAMTNYMNPILDTIRIFPFMEWCLSKIGIYTVGEIK